MALRSPSEPLLVRSADVTAKNRRAVESARARASPSSRARPHFFPLSSRAGASGTSSSSRDADASNDARGGGAVVKFTRRPEESMISRIIRLLRSLRARRANAPREAPGPGLRAYVLRPLARVSAIVSMAPDPTGVLLLLILLALLLVHFREHAKPAVGKSILGAYTLFYSMALVWGRAKQLAHLRAGRQPGVHPAQRALDGYEFTLLTREEAVKAGRDELRKNRAQLDALRAELARDPAARDPAATLIPSRKAAVMIKAGALGAGYDAEKAQEAERLRKEQNLAKSRAEWRDRAEKAQGEQEATRESLQMLHSHAATGYRKHTKELKMRAAPGTTPRSGTHHHLAAAIGGNLKKVVTAPHFGSQSASGSVSFSGVQSSSQALLEPHDGLDGAADVEVSEESRRNSGQSQGSASSASVNTDEGRRKIRLFRRKKSRDEVQEGDDSSRRLSRVGLRIRRTFPRSASEAG